MTTLPLMESALLSTAIKSLVQIEIEPRPLIPERPLQAGEQYRFHFDMTKCIGCKCCVVVVRKNSIRSYAALFSKLYS
jgi:formate hydrogenlyase subunit 6/NADH:ubiquinone oxidoreductase subunit I